MITLPIGISLKDWAASLIVDFPDEIIPGLFDEDNWKLWGNIVVQTSTFSENGAPGTEDYDDWNTWAQAVYYTLDNA